MHASRLLSMMDGGGMLDGSGDDTGHGVEAEESTVGVDVNADMRW